MPSRRNLARGAATTRRVAEGVVLVTYGGAQVLLVEGMSAR